MFWKRSIEYDNSDKAGIKEIITDEFVDTLPLKKSWMPYKRPLGRRFNQFFARGIFYDFLRIVLDECIEHNYKFLSPNRECWVLYIREMPRASQRFNMAKKGCYDSVDPFASDFKIYHFVIVSKYFMGKKYRTVRVSNSIYQRVVQKVNQGKRYFRR